MYKMIEQSTPRGNRQKKTRRGLLLLGLMLAAVLPVHAADYVLTYVNGGTTYYLARSGTSGVQRTSTFDPTTCIWSCENTGGTASTLNNSDTYGWLYQTVGGTKYYLSASTENLTLVTNASKGTDRDSRNYTMWRTDGTYLYNYYRYRSGRTNYTNSYYVNLATGVTRNETATTASNARPYQVTTNVVAEAITGSLSTPTITPSAAQTVEYGGSVSYTASATGPTRIVPAHTTYAFNSTTIFYYNNQAYTSTNAFATNNPAVTYTWALSDDGASALELMSTSGANTIVNYKHSASGTTATLTATARVGTLSRTASVTINVTPVEPTAISATGTTLYVGGNGTVAYSLTPDYAYNRVNVASGNTGVFTVTSPATTGGVDITPVAAGEATLTLTALNSGGSNGPSTSVTVTVRDICAVPEFSFTQSGSSVLATITTTTPDATIRYTTDGTDPTPTTGTEYTGPFTSANGQTIKAIAVKGEYYDASAVATKTVNPIDYIQQGVSGGIVTLNDLEDHRWSYYQSSGNLPTGYPTTYLSSPDPRNVKLTYMRGKVSGASEVAISAIEGDTMMVYYMTREKSVPGMTGDYPYTVISNPYSKRPRTTGSTGTNGFYGFAGWKVISGGEYISEYNNGATIPLDATIHFTNFDTYDTNAISADIVLQATWTAATVTRGASAPTFSGGTYETNFWVLSGNPTGAVTVPANSTMTARYPDGTSSWDGNFTRAITAGGNNAKVEWVNMNSTADVTASNYTFTMGRGIVNSGNGGELSGVSRDANANQTVKIESGTYNTMYNFSNGLNAARTCDQLLILGCDYDRAKNDNTKLIVRGDMYVGRGVQLNRAANSLYTRTYIKSGNLGSTVTVSGNTDYTGAGGTNTYYYSVANTHNTGRRYLCMEGGRIDGIAGGMDETNAQTSTVRAFDLRVKGNAQIDGVVYGAAEFANGKGIRTMVFTGGTVNGWVAGGANGTQSTNGALTGSSYVYMGGTAKVESDNHTQVMNRAVGGNVFGAGCGYSASSSSGQVTVETNVVLADEAYVERGVYGGGSYGYTTATANLYILGGTVGGQPGGVNGTTYSANITGGVFGGACQNQGGTVNIYMNGGLVQGGVYGGSNADGDIQNSVTMHIDGGQVGTTTTPANIHGGGYGSATRVNGNVDLTLGKDCNATSGVTVYGDVYGGSAEGIVNSSSSNHTNVTLYKGTIYGALYGGGLGSNSNPAYVYGPVAVSVFGGSVRTNDGSGENGSGGVFGCNNVNGTPLSTVTVDIYGTDPAPDAGSFALFAVYGGGNRSHYTANVPVVTIHGCSNSIEYVYGGGNASNVPGTNVTIWGGHIGNAFGGGNGYSVTGNHGDASAPHYNPGANITASGANLTIHGGTIDAAFGGSNQWGYINGGITVAVEDQDETGSDPCSRPYTVCDKLIVELYGGGNQAPAVDEEDVYISPDVKINSCNMEITNLFGGAKNANHGANINLEVTNGKFENVFGGNNLGGTITGNITLTLKGGTMVNAFGGNNQGGSITGTITVLVDSTGTECPLKVDNVYGGGNMAAYSPNDPTAATPTVNFVNGTVRNAVFGGGLGDAAKITANPTVTIGGTGTKTAIVGGTKIDGTPGDGNVYGGGSQADVLKDGAGTGNTSVTLTGNAIVKGNVYGGGNEANVQGNTNVELR